MGSEARVVVPRLPDATVRALALVLGPGYVREAAAHHGGGNLVAGAAEAWKEAREIALDLLQCALARLLASAEAMEAALRRAASELNLRSVVQPVEEIEVNEWRDLASVCAQGTTWPILGWTRVRVPRGTPSGRVAASVLRATADAVRRHSELNRAVLCGRLYARRSAELLAPVRVGQGQLVAAPVDAAGASERAILRQLARVRRAQRDTEAAALRPLQRHLVREWTRAGFIASPAAAMVSDVSGTGVRRGTPAFVPSNGVPLSLVVGDVDPSSPDERDIAIGADHRVFDPDVAGLLHEWLRQEVPALCEGWSLEGAAERDEPSRSD